MSREVKECPWDIENVQVPKGEDPEDVIRAIRYFVESLGFKPEFKITIFTASPLTVYSRLKAMEQVKIVSCAESEKVTYSPKQIADRLMKKFVKNVCHTTNRGLVVIVGGNEGYRSLFQHIKKEKKLEIIWIYPSDVIPNSELRATAMRISVASVCFEDLLKNFKTYRRANRSAPRLAVAPSVAVKAPLMTEEADAEKAQLLDGAAARRSRETPSRRRSPVPRRGASSRRLPDSPPRRRPGSPIRRRGETPPRRRPASPSSPSSPSPRRVRSPLRRSPIRRPIRSRSRSIRRPLRGKRSSSNSGESLRSEMETMQSEKDKAALAKPGSMTEEADAEKAQLLDGAAARRSRETPSRRRSPVPRRGASSRRLPDSPPRRRPGSPIRRRGETPPRRRPASPSSPSSPSPRRFRSPPRARSPAGRRGRSSSYSSSPAGRRGRSSSYSSSPSPRRNESLRRSEMETMQSEKDKAALAKPGSMTEEADAEKAQLLDGAAARRSRETSSRRRSPVPRRGASPWRSPVPRSPPRRVRSPLRRSPIRRPIRSRSRSIRRPLRGKRSSSNSGESLRSEMETMQSEKDKAALAKPGSMTEEADAEKAQLLDGAAARRSRETSSRRRSPVPRRGASPWRSPVPRSPPRRVRSPLRRSPIRRPIRSRSRSIRRPLRGKRSSSNSGESLRSEMETMQSEKDKAREAPYGRRSEKSSRHSNRDSHSSRGRHNDRDDYREARYGRRSERSSRHSNRDSHSSRGRHNDRDDYREAPYGRRSERSSRHSSN